MLKPNQPDSAKKIIYDLISEAITQAKAEAYQAGIDEAVEIIEKKNFVFPDQDFHSYDWKLMSAGYYQAIDEIKEALQDNK